MKNLLLKPNLFYLFLIVLLFKPNVYQAQTLKLVIQVESHSIHHNKILKNGVVYTKDAGSFITLPVESKDQITIQHEFYKDFSFQLPSDLKSSDTINKLVNLTPQFQALDEVVVSSSKYQNVFKNKDEFILDYFPFPPNNFYIITQYKRKYFVKVIDESGKELMTQSLHFKPQEIFLDALGNFHLSAKDSVYQFYTEDDIIRLMKPISKYDFEQDLKNLVTVGDKAVYYQKLSHHNQMFSLSEINEEGINAVYQSFDLEQYEFALYSYNKVIRYYMSHIPSSDNIILMGIWDGDLMTLNNYDVAIAEMTIWSDKIASKPLNVKSYGMVDEMVVLDGVKDSIVQIDRKILKTKEVKVQFNLSGDYFQDFFYDNLYMFSAEKDGTVVSKINCEDGTIKEITQITDIRQPRNIKVTNDKVFFMVLDENGYNRIIKVKD